MTEAKFKDMLPCPTCPSTLEQRNFKSYRDNEIDLTPRRFELKSKFKQQLKSNSPENVLPEETEISSHLGEKISLLGKKNLKNPFNCRSKKSRMYQNQSTKQPENFKLRSNEFPSSIEESNNSFSHKIHFEISQDYSPLEKNHNIASLDLSFSSDEMANDSQIDTIIKCLRDLERGKVCSMMGKFEAHCQKKKKTDCCLNEDVKKSFKISDCKEKKSKKKFSDFFLLKKHQKALERLHDKSWKKGIEHQASLGTKTTLERYEEGLVSGINSPNFN